MDSKEHERRMAAASKVFIEAQVIPGGIGGINILEQAIEAYNAPLQPEWPGDELMFKLYPFSKPDDFRQRVREALLEEPFIQAATTYATYYNSPHVSHYGAMLRRAVSDVGLLS